MNTGAGNQTQDILELESYTGAFTLLDLSAIV